MGGSFHAVVANDVADGILDFARGVNATQVLLGASRRGRLSTLLRPGIGETVIADSGDIDVHVVTHDFARRALPGGRPRSTVGRARQAFGFAAGRARDRGAGRAARADARTCTGCRPSRW